MFFLAVALTLSLLVAWLALRCRRGGDRNRASVDESKELTQEVEVLCKEKYPGGHITIYYGSQTGTAESFAEEIAREGEDNGFKVHVVDLEDIEDDIASGLLSKSSKDESGRNRAVFLMATYGEGEPTDNAAGFINFIKGKAGLKSNFVDSIAKEKDDGFAEEKKGDSGDDEMMGGSEGGEVEADRNFFCGLDYAVFALGNRQYEHFCAMGKLTEAALGLTGGNKIAQLGEGDDDNDLEGDFENWKDKVLWPCLKRRYIGDSVVKAKVAAGTNENGELPECHYSVEYLPNVDGANGAVKSDVVRSEDIHASTRHYFTAVDCPVAVSRQLRSSTDPGSTVHLEIDISKAGDDLRYQTADNLGVLPVNDDDVVEAVADGLGYDLDAVFRLKPAAGHEHKHAALFPSPCTVRECLARYCDLTCAPRRSDLKLLASYAKDPMDRNALLRMSSKEGKAEYREKIIGGHIGIADIVSRLCGSIEMPLEHFITVCPRLQPRYYTISSSSSLHPDSIHITVSVIKTEKRDGSVHKGVCSHHLAGIVDNKTVRVFCRDSSFRLPKDPSRPVIMVGPGTGVAPMRALLQERSHQKKKRKLSVGKNVLYFGCKTPTQDYLYEEELEKFQKEGTLNKLHVAFSRTSEKKVYVQHLLAKNAEETWNLVEREKASIYVCGGTKMGADVSDTLKSIVSEAGGMGPDEAKSYLDKMASEGRFVQELWSA